MSVTALGRSSLSSFPLLAGRPLLLLPRRRAPGAPAPQQNDPGRCEAHFDPIGALPALLPARVVADLWVEPDAGVFGLEHPFIRRVVPRALAIHWSLRSSSTQRRMSSVNFLSETL